MWPGDGRSIEGEGVLIMKIKIKPYLNPAIDKAMKEYKKGVFNEIAKKYAVRKKDYKAILRECVKGWGVEYLYGYIRCLCNHNLVDNMKEGMELIDYADSLIKKKGEL